MDLMVQGGTHAPGLRETYHEDCIRTRENRKPHHTFADLPAQTTHSTGAPAQIPEPMSTAGGACSDVASHAPLHDIGWSHHRLSISP
eukprot:1157418-Pelagomonas_calceolata.AAC.10